jgi:hypothetical protein
MDARDEIGTIETENDKAAADQLAFEASFADKLEKDTTRPKVEATPDDEEPEPKDDDEEPLGDEPTDEDEDSDTEELEPGDTTAEFDPEFATSLEKHGAKIDLDSLPKEVRAQVAQKVKHMDGAFTRAMMEARAYRKSEVELKAQLNFLRDNPVDAILDILYKHPEVGVKINAKIDEIGESDTAKKAHGIVVERAREDALTKERTTITTAEQQAKYEQAVERYTEEAAQKAGVPAELGIADAVGALIISKPAGQKVTRAEIDAIVASKAKAFKATQRQVTRDKAGQYVEDKVKDRKTAGLKVTPGRGKSPAPGGEREPANEAEFIEQAARRINAMHR